MWQKKDRISFSRSLPSLSRRTTRIAHHPNKNANLFARQDIRLPGFRLPKVRLRGRDISREEVVRGNGVMTLICFTADKGEDLSGERLKMLRFVDSKSSAGYGA